MSRKPAIEKVKVNRRWRRDIVNTNKHDAGTETVLMRDRLEHQEWVTKVDRAVNKIHAMKFAKAFRIIIQSAMMLLCVTTFAQNVEEIRIAPIPEPPVDGKVITVGPNSDIKKIIETAGHGTTIKFNSGKIEIYAISIPVGVNLDLGSVEIVVTQPGGFNKIQAGFRLESASRTSGNQWIRGGTITGRNASGGILIDGRDNVQIQGTKFRDFNFFGLWIKNSANGEARDLEFLNTSGAVSGWAAGELCIFNLTNWDIHHVKLKTTVPTRGYGIKALYGGGYLNNVRFANIETDLNHQSAWNNGASHNIGIELHDTILQGTITIENCTIRNQLSLACINPNPGKVVVRNNLFDMGNDRYSIEGIVNNLEVYGNTFKNSSQWIFNGKPTIKVSNWMVYNNTYDQGTAPTMSWGGVFLFGANGGQGITIKDNKIRHKAGNEILKFQGVSGGVNDVRSQNQITTF